MSLFDGNDWVTDFRLYTENELQKTYASLVSDLETSSHDKTAINLLHLVENEMTRRGIALPN